VAARLAATALVTAALSGKIAAIARLLSRVEEGGPAALTALEMVYAHAGSAHVVGLTGVPGSGKSTLAAQLARQFRAAGRRVGIVAVDPTSPFSGGSILGDRIRMNELSEDPGVFIRSMATRGALGGLSRATLDAVDVLDAAGYDLVLIETVGVGQDEVDVVRAAHTTVVVSAPGLGDDIQAVKAGILEIADVHAVSKCDRSDAGRTIADLKGMLAMATAAGATSSWKVPVVPTSAANGEGVAELCETVANHLAFLQASGEIEVRQQQIARQRVLAAAENILRDRFQDDAKGAMEELVADVAARKVHPYAAARDFIGHQEM
jgi:LAO/AO transport system kinase